MVIAHRIKANCIFLKFIIHIIVERGTEGYRVLNKSGF